MKNFDLVRKIYEKGLKQADFVKRTNIGSESKLSRIINYRKKPTDIEIKEICSLLSCEPCEVGFEK